MLFALTFDTDWAVPELIDDTLKILDDFHFSATFFITNSIDFSKFKNHELAIHPNFSGYSDQEEILKNTLDILPTKKSKGSRSHKLFHNSTLIASYEKFGIEYDSNYYIPDMENPEPFFFGYADVLEFPMFFADNGYFSTHNEFNITNINLEDQGTKVFLFHPFHIFMNTPNDDFYEKIKNNYKNFDFLQNNVNQGSGTRELFLNFLEHIEKNNIQTSTLEKINEEIRINRNQ